MRSGWILLNLALSCLCGAAVSGDRALPGTGVGGGSVGIRGGSVGGLVCSGAAAGLRHTSCYDFSLVL